VRVDCAVTKSVPPTFSLTIASMCLSVVSENARLTISGGGGVCGCRGRDSVVRLCVYEWMVRAAVDELQANTSTTRRLRSQLSYARMGPSHFSTLSTSVPLRLA
jgi:hypothetical protein